MSNLPDHQKDLAEAQKNLRRSACILILAFILWPLGLFFHPLASLLIFAVLLTLGGISTYISFMHRLSAKNKIDNHGK